MSSVCRPQLIEQHVDVPTRTLLPPSVSRYEATLMRILGVLQGLYANLTGLEFHLEVAV